MSHCKIFCALIVKKIADLIYNVYVFVSCACQQLDLESTVKLHCFAEKNGSKQDVEDIN